MKFVFNIFILVFITISYAQAQVTVDHHQEVGIDALRFWYADSNKVTHKFNQNISPKGDSMQVTNGYVFFTWYKGGMNQRNLMLSRMDLQTKNWVTIEFPDKNSLYTSGEYKGGGNSHRTTAVGVSPIDGTVHLVFDMHTDELKYRVSDKNIAFAPDSQFTLANFSSRRNFLRWGEPILSFTYPNFEVNDAGELVVEYRRGTSRQGDKYVTFYNGDVWSSSKLVMRGNNENPEFNQYGGFTYQFGKMYLATSIRVKGSSIDLNQGFYFAEAGQRADETRWKDVDGNNISVPVEGLTDMNRLRVARPLTDADDTRGMSSAPSLVVSKNRAIHMTNSIRGKGTVHYYSAPGSNTMTLASGRSPNVSFGGTDGRIYSVGLDGNGRVAIQSTPEGQHNWRQDFVWNSGDSFGLLKFSYDDGVMYVIASEKRNSDRLPIHYAEITLHEPVSPNQPTDPITTPINNPISCPSTNILSKTEAENTCDSRGVEIENTSDAGGGRNVGYLHTGDWMEYGINVPRSGEYEISFRVAARSSNISFDVLAGSHNLTKITDVNSSKTGGWQTWKTVTRKVQLSAGEQTIRLQATGGGWNINWLRGASISHAGVLSVCGTMASSAEGENVAANTVDVDLKTRWSANGNNQTLTVNLCNEASVEQVGLAFYKGNVRTANFDIQTSLDGNNWVDVLSGATSNGNSLQIEMYNLTSSTAKYIRYIGYGNSANAWNSVTEIEFLGSDTAAVPTQVDPVIESFDSQQAENVAANILDGDTGNDSRWSTKGFPKSVTVDLGVISDITGTQLWAYKNRAYQYRIEVSNNPSSGFVTLADNTGNTENAQPIETNTSATARYVKLTVTGAFGYADDWVSINEFEIETETE